MKFSIKDFFSKCVQIRKKLKKFLLKRSLMKKIHFLCNENCFSANLKSVGYVIYWNFMQLFQATAKGNSKKILAKVKNLKRSHKF